MTQMNLGNALRNLGIYTDNTQTLHDAVTAFNEALKVIPQDTKAIQWAMAQMNLGNVLQNLGTRTENPEVLRHSIEAYKAALEEFTRKDNAMNWATTQMNLGGSLHSLAALTGEVQSVCEAIQTYKLALEVTTRKLNEMDWGSLQMNLALAHFHHAQHLPHEDALVTLTDGLRCTDNALAIFTPETAAAYHDRATQIRDAILAALDALDA